MVATLVAGLGADSRFKMKVTGAKAPANTILLAMIFDACHLLVWKDTEDGRKNRNRPKSVVQILTNGSDDQKPVAFESGEEFMKAYNEMVGRIREEENA